PLSMSTRRHGRGLLSSTGDRSEKTAGHGNGRPVCQTARKRSVGQKQEAGPKALAERSEGTMEARQGRNPEGGAMQSTTARPAIFLGRGRPDINAPVFSHVISLLAPLASQTI